MKLLLILMCFFCSYSVFSQDTLPKPYQILGSKNAGVQTYNFFCDSIFRMPVYKDTAAANENRTVLYPYSHITTQQGGGIDWYRNSTGVKWVQVGSGGNPNALVNVFRNHDTAFQTTSGGTTSQAFTFPQYTLMAQSPIIGTQINDTTIAVGVDTTTILATQYYVSQHGGGGSQTLQQTVTLGNKTNLDIEFDSSKTLFIPSVNGGVLEQINSPISYTGNVNWQKTISNTLNSDATYNHPVRQGFNIDGNQNAGQGGIWDAWENRYKPFSTKMMERHIEVYIPGGVLKQVRLQSFTVQEMDSLRNSTAILFQSVTGWELRDLSSNIYASIGCSQVDKSFEMQLRSLNEMSGIHIHGDSAYNNITIHPHNYTDADILWEAWRNMIFGGDFAHKWVYNRPQNLHYQMEVADTLNMQGIGGNPVIAFPYANDSKLSIIADFGTGEARWFSKYKTSIWSQNAEHLRFEGSNATFPIDNVNITGDGNEIKLKNTNESDADAGTISVGRFSDAMDIVGSSNTNTFRKIDIWGQLRQQQNNGENLLAGNNLFGLGYFRTQIPGTGTNDFYIYDNNLDDLVFNVDGDDRILQLNPSNSNYHTVIGSNTGAYPLTIKQSGVNSGYGTMQMAIQQSDSEVGIQFDNQGTNGGSRSIFVTNDASGLGGGNFVIANTAHSRADIVIDDGGNVGINKYTSLGYKFNVEGDAYISQGLNVAGGLTNLVGSGFAVSLSTIPDADYTAAATDVIIDCSNLTATRNIDITALTMQGQIFTIVNPTNDDQNLISTDPIYDIDGTIITQATKTKSYTFYYNSSLSRYQVMQKSN